MDNAKQEQGTIEVSMRSAYARVDRHGVERMLRESDKYPQPIRERALAFAVRIVRLCSDLHNRGGEAHLLSKQLLRSGTSIGANLEEADAAQSRADFIHKCTVALKEARETRFWLRLIVAGEIVPEQKLSQLIQESNEIVAILTTIVKKSRAANQSIRQQTNNQEPE